MRIDGQVVGLRTVALEKTCQRLAGIHDAEISGVVDQLFVTVWAWRGCADQLERNTFKQIKERLIGLAAETAQHACFVKATCRGKTSPGQCHRRGRAHNWL